MPSYVFAALTAHTPEYRDANGLHLGTVEPGDIRFFDDPPPDGLWTPELPPHPEDDGEEEGGEGQPATPQPPGPVPAPPAVPAAQPPVTSVTENQEG